MNHEDKLRAAFRRADAALPDRGLDLEATMKMAHRSRRIYVAAASVAAVLLVVGGVWAAGTIGDGGTSPVPPAGSPDQTPSVSPSPSVSPTPPSSGPVPTCSARGSGVLSSGGEVIPDPVAATREELIDLAAACDFDGLASVAERSEFFTYSFGGSGEAAEHWRRADKTDDVMATLIEILQMSHEDNSAIGGEVIYEWPAVAGKTDPTDADWDEVRGLYSDEEIEQMKEFGSYIGYRAGITETGDWLFFVAGD